MLIQPVLISLFKITLSISVNNVMQSLFEITLNLKIVFGKIMIFKYVNSTNPEAWEVFPYSGIFLDFLYKDLKFSLWNFFYLLGQVYSMTADVGKKFFFQEQVL